MNDFTARRVRGAMAAAALALSVATGSAAAQTAAFPSKQITMIVVFAAGGTTDVLARMAAEHMSRTLGQPIVVENVAGAGGTTGGARAAKATPDGYTLAVGSMGSHSATPSLYKSPGFDPREQEAIGVIAGTPGYFVVRKDFPAQTLKEYIDYATRNPGKVTVAHAGIGSTNHLACLYLEHLAKVRTTQVPYRGNGPAMNDLVAGQVDAMCDLAPTAVPQIQAGTVRSLMIATAERSATAPGVPTAKEAGLPDYLFTGWNAIFAPPATPRPIVDKLSDALRKAVLDPAMRKRFEDLGAVPPGEAEATPAALKALVARQVEQWATVIKAAGVTPQ